MRLAIVLVAGLLGAGGAAMALLDAQAQQYAPPSPAASADPATDDAPRTGGAHRMAGWQQAHAPGAVPPALSLLFTAPDRQLSQADVQKIAEAYLLWHGNHEWRVTNLASDTDRVTFTITTAQNAPIATFAMDRHTGALVRTG